jgi:hypothetical protein
MKKILIVYLLVAISIFIDIGIHYITDLPRNSFLITLILIIIVDKEINNES